jgi:hypothetical protein
MMKHTGTQSKDAATPTFIARRDFPLQRKYACGSSTSSLTGECAECKSKQRPQTKLTIGASNDPLEREADQVADQVLAAPADSAVSGVPPHIQRFTGQATGQADTAPASVDRVLASPGRPLNPTLRQDMEQRFGHDFSRVRVHSGAAAEQSAQEVNANAYTVGPNIVFGAGRFAPGTLEGRRLIAHELTHVVQQSSVDGIDADRGEKSAAVSVQSAWQMTLRRDGGEEGKRSDAPAPAGGEGAEKAPAPTGAAGGASCDPRGLLRADYLKEPGTTTDDFGLTTLRGTVTVPAVHVSKSAKGLVLDPTDAKLPPLTSVYTAADAFIEGTIISVGESTDCPSGKKYPLKWRILPSGAQKIREGEIEHCDDFRYAFDVSLRRYADTVNDLAAKQKVFASQRAAEKYVTGVVGPKPDSWADIFTCLARKTKLRDANNWHTPRPLMRPPKLDDDCKFATAYVSSLPGVGMHPTPDVIKDCGEGPPAAVKGGGKQAETRKKASTTEGGE